MKNCILVMILALSNKMHKSTKLHMLTKTVYAIYSVL